MKQSILKDKVNSNEVFNVEMMRNPAELTEWVIWIRDASGKSFLLTNDIDVVMAEVDINKCLGMLRNLGIKNANITL